MDNNGVTPLHLAVRPGRSKKLEKLAKLLRQHDGVEYKKSLL